MFQQDIIKRRHSGQVLVEQCLDDCTGKVWSARISTDDHRCIAHRLTPNAFIVAA